MSKQSKRDHELSAFGISREFWYQFVRTKIRPPEQCKQGEEPVAAADIALQLFDRSDYRVNMGRVNNGLMNMLEFSQKYREMLIARENEAREGENDLELPPLSFPMVQFHPVDKEGIAKNIHSDADRAAMTGDQRPVSWLFQKRFGQGEDAQIIPCIAVDRSCVTEFLGEGRGRGIQEHNLIVLRVILHELCHYLMHWRALLPAGLPQNQFHYEWANTEEEEQAWIGCSTIIGLGVAAIAAGSRVQGGFDAAWKFP